MEEFLKLFGNALKIVNAGTAETSVDIWAEAEGREFILTLRQATDKDREEHAQGSSMTVHNPNLNNLFGSATGNKS